MSDKDRLTRDLSENMFAAFETALYLDAHPKNADALKAWRTYTDKAQALKKEYEEKYGMITKSSPSAQQSEWAWIKSPWPWQ